MSFTSFNGHPLHTREEIARTVHAVSLRRGLDELATVIALMTIATFRLSRRIAKDPVTAPLRAPFTVFQGASGEAEIAEEVREHGGVKHAVGELVTCPFCLAQWVATALVFSYAAAPRAARLAALTMTMVAGSDVLQFVYDAIQNGGLSPAD